MLRRDPDALQRAIKRAGEEMRAGIQRMHAALREVQTPEQRERDQQRAYARKIKGERELAKAHLRHEVRRVREELGLPDKTGA